MVLHKRKVMSLLRKKRERENIVICYITLHVRDKIIICRVASVYRALILFELNFKRRINIRTLYFFCRNIEILNILLIISEGETNVRRKEADDRERNRQELSA